METRRRQIDLPPVNDIDDDELLAARAGRDRAAFAALYDRYAEAVYRYCWRRLGEREAAEDATSLVFTRALAAIEGYRAGSFRSWLFTIAHHTIVDQLRREAPARTLDQIATQPSREPSPETRFLAAEEDRRLQTLLAHLTPDQRRVIELRLTGFAANEIAEILGRKRNAVDALQHRAIARLRDLYAAETEREDDDATP